MQARGVVSNKQQLISILEQTYIKATSQADFYQKLQQENIELYSRNNTIVGAKLKRKFRFKSLGYDEGMLRELNKNLTQNKRFNMLKSIREEQQNQSKEMSKGHERTRKRGR